MKIKQGTRDNLIYLAVGLGLAGLLAADAFYADSHGREMWMPSSFAFRVVGYIGILDYFVARETRKVKATLIQTVMCVLASSILHLGIAFAFRQTYAGRLTLRLWGLAILEFFVIEQLMVQSVQHFKSQ